MKCYINTIEETCGSVLRYVCGVLAYNDLRIDNVVWNASMQRFLVCEVECMKKLAMIFIAAAMVMTYTFAGVLSASYADSGVTSIRVDSGAKQDSATSYTLDSSTDWIVVKQASGKAMLWTRDNILKASDVQTLETEIVKYITKNRPYEGKVDGSIKSVSSVEWSYKYGNGTFTPYSDNNWGAYKFTINTDGTVTVNVYNSASNLTLDAGRVSHIDFGGYTLPDGTTEVKEDNSTTTPDNPTTTPDNPTATPDNPTTTPDNPTATPDNPTTTPDNPTTTPDNPTTTPDNPTTTPDNPTTAPDNPTTAPDNPTTAPDNPTTTPDSPTTTPDNPTTTPDNPTTTPDNPTDNGSGTTTDNGNTDNPGTTPTAPVVITPNIPVLPADNTVVDTPVNSNTEEPIVPDETTTPAEVVVEDVIENNNTSEPVTATTTVADNAENDNADQPQTGDENDMAPWVITLAGGAVLAFAAAKRRKDA